jgi:hypothetical protein
MKAAYNAGKIKANLCRNLPNPARGTMKDWTEGRLLSTLVAEAEVAPIDTIAQVV